MLKYLFPIEVLHWIKLKIYLLIYIVILRVSFIQKLKRIIHGMKIMLDLKIEKEKMLGFI